MHRQSPPDNLDTAETRRILDAVTALAAEDARIETGVPLSGLTTFRIGGPAAGLRRIRTPQEAAEFLEIARARRIPVLCLGGGSNVLIDDRGFCGLVLRMEIDAVSAEGGSVTAGAGLAFDDLIAWTLDRGLTGLEFASGIPGSVGGAVAGNAGCYGHEIGEFLTAALVLGRDGALRRIPGADLGFSYRHSRLKESGELLLEVVLRLQKGDIAAARAVREEKLAERRVKHPWDEPCAGSYFKNLDPAAPGERRRAAGQLLDQAGVHGLRVGGAAIFPRHANIIVNTGAATCRDVLELAALMKERVRERFGVELQEEVRHIPWGGDPGLICG